MKRMLLLVLFFTVAFATDIIKFPVGASTDLDVGTVVKIAGGDTIAACVEGDEPVGVIMNYEGSGTSREYLVGSAGVVPNVLCGSAITAGDKLVPTAAGAVQPLSSDPDGHIVGFALESGASGERIKIMVSIAATGGAGANQTITTGAGVSGAESGSSGDLTIDVGAGWGISTSATQVSVNQTTLDGRYLDNTDNQNLSFTGTASPYTLDIEGGSDVTFAQGSGITLSRSSDQLTITNASPDQTVSLTGGTNISVSGSYPNFTIDVSPQGSGSNLDADLLDGHHWSEIPSLPSNNVTGSGTATQVAYWDGSNTITGESNLYWDSSSDRLGIGTSSPVSNLEVREQTYGTPGIITISGSSGSYDDVYGQLVFRNPWSGGTSASIKTITGGSTEGYGHSHLAFFTSIPSGSPTEKMRIKSNGNVGIGTSSPSAKLHVIGDARVTGKFYDSSGDAGSSGQILSSTGSGTNWITGGGGITSVNAMTGPAISIVGGTAIGVSNGSNTVTINNNGVTSLTGGTNISASGATGAVTVSVSPQGSGSGLDADMVDGHHWSSNWDTNGDITSVNAGTGLTGGGTSGDVTLSSQFWSLNGSYSPNRITNGSYDLWLSSGLGGNRHIYFGDGSYVYVGESSTDDELMLYGTNVRIRTGGRSYRWPYSDGSNGQVLKTDGSGNLSWTTVGGGSSQWTDAGSYIYANNNSSARVYDSGQSYGIYASTNHNSIYGTSSSSTSGEAGIKGYNTSSSLNTYGIYGSSSGYSGVFGYGPEYGLWANGGTYGAWLYGTTYGAECSGHLAFWGSSDRIYIGSDYGSSGEVLTSNGSSGIYWGSGGGGTPNLSSVLGAGNSAGSYDINMNWNDIWNVNTIQGNHVNIGGSSSQPFYCYGTYMSTSGNLNMSNHEVQSASKLQLYYSSSSVLDMYYGKLRDYYGNYGSSGQMLTSYGTYVLWTTPGGGGGGVTGSGTSGHLTRWTGSTSLGNLSGSYSTYYWGGVLKGESSSDGHQLLPGADWYGYVGTSSTAWYKMYSYSFNVASRRELKRGITPIDKNATLRNLVMADIDAIQPSFYKYKRETDTLEPGNETKYRPNMHIGVIVDESPDYIKDNTFSDIDLYGLASLSLAGVKYNRADIKEMKTKITDFGTATMNGDEMWVSFSDEFTSQLGDNTPVITVTPSSPSVVLCITEKNNRGFKVAGVSENDGFSFDWIAMAKVATEPNKSEIAGRISPELMEQLRVPAEKKQLAKDWVSKRDAKMEANAPLPAESSPLWFDEYGNQIPPEWVDTLRAAGYTMFTKEEADHRRLDGYLDNAKALKFAAYKQAHPEKYAQPEEPQTSEKSAQAEEPQIPQQPVWCDVHGNVIPTEWVDTLRAVGYPMITLEQATQHRLEGYISDAKQINWGKEHAKPVRFERELMENGLMKITDLETGEVLYKNERGQVVSADGMPVNGGGIQTEPSGK